jgi:hypothetical protein
LELSYAAAKATEAAAPEATQAATAAPSRIADTPTRGYACEASMARHRVATASAVDLLLGSRPTRFLTRLSSRIADGIVRCMPLSRPQPVPDLFSAVADHEPVASENPHPT